MPTALTGAGRGEARSLPDASASNPDELPSALAADAIGRVHAELDTSYRELQAQVRRLRAELAVGRRARLAQLEEKERLLERLRALLTVLPGGVLVLDARRVIRDANRAALRILGEPLIGENWADVIARNPELEGRVTGDRYLSVETSTLASFDETVVLITDTTQIHDLQNQLGRRHRLAAMGEMAARLAHQIRTPLSCATLYLAQLAQDDLASAQRRHIVSRLGERLAYTESLIESMLGFVRGRPPELRPVALRDVFDRVRRTTASGLRDGVTLEIGYLDGTLRLQAAADELAGALCNLVQNAAELEQDRVDIVLWGGATSPESLQISVRDNGPGIDDEILPRLFDPFFTTRARGTGLGLAVVAMTVAQHGGEVRARNHGQGAEFLIDLPLLARSNPERDDTGTAPETEPAEADGDRR